MLLGRKVIPVCVEVMLNIQHDTLPSLSLFLNKFHYCMSSVEMPPLPSVYVTPWIFNIADSKELFTNMTTQSKNL
jgi:hypothetical protein